jgi:hypothetical protein
MLPSVCDPAALLNGRYRILDVVVRRCAADPKAFEWKVLESDRTVVASSTRTYATEREALHDANKAGRKIRRTEP